MKEVYLSPEAKLLGFAPAEHLANDMDVILDSNSTTDKVSGVIVDPGFDVDLKL